MFRFGDNKQVQRIYVRFRRQNDSVLSCKQQAERRRENSRNQSKPSQIYFFRSLAVVYCANRLTPGSSAHVISDMFVLFPAIRRFGPSLARRPKPRKPIVTVWLDFEELIFASRPKTSAGERGTRCFDAVVSLSRGGTFAFVRASLAGRRTKKPREEKLVYEVLLFLRATLFY